MADEGRSGLCQDPTDDQDLLGNTAGVESTVYLCQTKEGSARISAQPPSTTCTVIEMVDEVQEEISEVESEEEVVIVDEGISEASKDFSDDQDLLEDSTMSMVDPCKPKGLLASPSTESSSSTKGTEIELAQPSLVVPSIADSTPSQRQPTRIIPGASLMMRLALPEATCSARVGEVGLVEVSPGLESAISVR